jgi:peptide deformylase
MELVKADDPILKTKCENFNFQDPQVDPIQLAQEMVKFVYDNNGVGITANQLGLPLRVFAMRAFPENFVCFNPKIVQASEQQVVLEETSLSHKGLIVKIKRPQHVRVRFSLPNGETRTDTFTGLSARIFQHCLDFLDGKEYYNRANAYHKEQAFKRWKKDEHILR